MDCLRMQRSSRVLLRLCPSRCLALYPVPMSHSWVPPPLTQSLPPHASLAAGGLLVGQGLYLFGDYWLSLWASKGPEEQREGRWIWVYAIIVGVVLAISFARRCGSVAVQQQHLLARTRIRAPPPCFRPRQHPLLPHSMQQLPPLRTASGLL